MKICLGKVKSPWRMKVDTHGIELSYIIIEDCSLLLILSIGLLILYFIIFWIASTLYKETEEVLEMYREESARSVDVTETFFGELVSNTLLFLEPKMKIYTLSLEVRCLPHKF